MDNPSIDLDTTSAISNPEIIIRTSIFSFLFFIVFYNLLLIYFLCQFHADSTIVSKSYCGVQPNLSLIFVASAIKISGSPSRRSSKLTVKSFRVTFLTVSLPL